MADEICAIEKFLNNLDVLTQQWSINVESNSLAVQKGLERCIMNWFPSEVARQQEFKTKI